MQKHLLFSIAIFLSLVRCSSPNATTDTSVGTVNEAIFNHSIEVRSAFNIASTSSDTSERSGELLNFYEQRNGCSFWLGSSAPMESLILLERWLKRYGDKVLPSETNLLNKLSEITLPLYNNGDENPEKIAAADKKITRLYADYFRHLGHGELETDVQHRALFYVEQPQLHVLRDLLELDETYALDSLLNSYRPELPEYERLVKAYNQYHKKDDSAQIQLSCDDLPWSSDLADSLAPQVQYRLEYWGVAFADSLSSADSTIVKSIEKFQKLRGIEPTGNLDCTTISALNLSSEELLNKITLNLERLRALPRRLGREYIIVNVPEYKLRIIRDNQVSYEMNVIVGKEYTPTPVFADTLSHIVFSPTWTVPQSIVQGEMIPNLQKNSGHYIAKNFKAFENGVELDQRIVDWSDSEIGSRHFTFVQQPGASNALGLVKFIMPNNLSVYLHDTPTDYLFDRTQRALSHGCIRLEYPKELAMYLLSDDPSWTEAKITEAMHQTTPQTVYLDNQIPVEIVYLTTWVDEDGYLRILPDIYGHDNRQIEFLSSK